MSRPGGRASSANLQAPGAARRSDKLGMNLRRRGEQQSMPRFFLIVARRLTFEIGQPSAGFMQD